MTFKNCKRIEELIDIAFLLFCFDLIVFLFFFREDVTICKLVIKSLRYVNL